MQLITQIINMLLSLLSLALMAWIGWQGYSLLTTEQQAFRPEIQAALVIAAVLFLVCSYMISRAINKSSIQTSLGSHKADVYQQYLKRWLDQQLDDSEALEALKVSAAMVAGNAVFEKMNKLEALTLKEGYSSEKALAAFKSLLMTMRRDLGLSTNFTAHKEFDQLLF